MAKKGLYAIFLLLIVFEGSLWAQSGASLRGVVNNPQGDAVANASVSVYDDKQILVGSAVTDGEGAFTIERLPIGSYEVVVEANNFATYRKAVRVSGNDEQKPLEITLQVTAISEGVTVTAVVNEVQDIFESSQQINIVTTAEIARRSAVILPQFFQEETGLRVQQASSNQGSVIIRGLTGQRVVTLIDGIRFNNSTFSTGNNQYLGLIDSSIVNRVEVVHGPGSAQYGSDALGGTINVLSDRPRFSSTGLAVNGELNTFFGSADLSSGGNVKVALGAKDLSLVVSGFGRRVNDLRAGQGVDSHSIVTRLFGLPSSVLGEDLQDTAFTQFGGFAKFVYKPRSDQQASLFYHRSDQRNVRRYDLLNGGAGARMAGFTPQVLDFFYGRYEKQGIGFIDSLAGTFSFNRQRDNFQIQFGSDLSPVTFEFTRRDAFGYNLQGTTHIGSRQFIAFGGDIYDENVKITRSVFNPAINSFSAARGSFPNGSKYQSYGVYVQDSVEVLPGRFSINGGVRYSAFIFKTFATSNPFDNAGRPSVPNSSLRTDDLTFNFGGSFFVTPNLNLSANVSRGFRAPNIIDLGTIGNNAGGVEVSARSAIKLGGFIGTTADTTARSTGKLVTELGAERLFNYEAGVKYQRNGFYGTFSFFNSDISDFVLKRTLILPRGAVGKELDGQRITFQDAITGSVRTEDSIRPVVVTVNSGEVRIYGFEASTQLRVTDAFTISGNLAYLRGEDKNPAPLARPVPGIVSIVKAPDAPDIRGGLPPLNGFFSLRYQPAGKRYWIETYTNFASLQDRLSSSDLADVSIGATRNRGLVAFFFNGRARQLGLIGNGRDNRPFTPDDTLKVTGETLTQIQDRVLGRGIQSSPFALSTPGYATFNVRGGYEFGERSSLNIILENILDKNYRLHGSGIDAPGINLVVRYSLRF